MSRWLALAKISHQVPICLPDTLTEPDKRVSAGGETGFCRVLSGCRVEKSNQTHDGNVEHGGTISQGDPGTRAQTTAVGKRPVTWTGKVVSLADWRQLSDWERNGPDGRQWNGATRRWEGVSAKDVSTLNNLDGKRK